MRQKTKHLVKIILSFSLLAFLGCAESNKVKINPNVKLQKFEGFGEGSMGQVVPMWYTKYTEEQRNDFLDKLYTLEKKGLGIRICRFLMPVGDAPGHNHMTRYVGQDHHCPKSFEPEEGKFDWEGHEPVLWRVRGAVQRGAVMWSSWFAVPYWMTVSGCTAGSEDGASNNLRTDMEERFIKHVCDVTKYFRDQWNIEFDYLSLINEPDADWWKKGGGQPGCRVTSDQAIRLYQYLNKALPQYGLTPKQIAYDSAYTNGHRIQYLNNILKSDIINKIHTLACHQYQTSEEGFLKWKKAAKKYNKSLWMTEWGDWEQAEIGRNNNEQKQAMNYAGKIHEAFEVLGANGWVMWEPWLIFNFKHEPFEPRKVYWVIAHYSRHVRPGMQMIKTLHTNKECGSTAWTDSNNSVVIVTVNKSTEAVNTEYDLSKFPELKIQQIFQTDAEKNYKEVDFSQNLPDSFSIDLPGESVTTIIGSVKNEKKGSTNVQQN